MRFVKILVVDDFKLFRQSVSLTLQQRTEFEVIGEASDGFEAVRQAQELQPDLILLDIGLPDLNGIEVARRVGKLVPAAKILFLSVESSREVVREALSVGARGFVHKPRAHSDLVPAIDAVLVGELFVSSSLEFREGSDAQTPHHHEIFFCSDEATWLDCLTRFIAAAINAGDAAIVWATESHRDSLRQRLVTQDVDIDAAILTGIYISLDDGEPPDPVRTFEAVRGLSAAARKAGKKHPRVAVCGERAGRLWAEGKTDMAIRLEQLCNELTREHDVDVLCVYPLPRGQEDDHAFASIRAEHSAVYSL